MLLILNDITKNLNYEHMIYLNMVLTILDHHTTVNNGDPRNMASNYMKVDVNGKEIELPYFCASKSDYDKSAKSGVNLASKVFQCYVNLTRADWGNIAEIDKQNKLSTNFNKIQEKYNPLISDINFWWDGHEWTDAERNAALNLQLTLQTDFLSDVVRDRDNITMDLFEEQLEDLLNHDTEKIKCPSISMKTPIDIFRSQLQLISDKNFKRFNVDWTGITNYEPWQLLTSFLKNNKIWCNMTSINSRRQGATRKSNAMLGFAHGAHTCGLGYMIFPREDGPDSSLLLNQNSFCYETDDNPNYELSDSVSHNRLFQRVLESHGSINDDTYYNNFLPADFLQI